MITEEKKQWIKDHVIQPVVSVDRIIHPMAVEFTKLNGEYNIFSDLYTNKRIKRDPT